MFLIQASAVSAGSLYRYKDANGVVVLGITVPPELVKNGYEVLNQNGRVIKVIPPALTPEQIRLRDAAALEESKRQKAREAQLRKDRELLRLYSHPDDIIMIWQRKLDDINSVITLKEESILLQNNKLERYQTQAADAERSGKKVSNKLINDMTRTQEKIAKLIEEIASHKADLKAQSNYFQARMDRLIQLKKRQPSLPVPE
ncbi:MAG: ABC transporter ATPase [Proteobacteria bacterium]|nr:MAG: ABC transporter ATPase [Pseudomonadota bacterium]